MKLDWDAGHGPVTGPINTATAALSVGFAGHAAHMPTSWAAAAAGAGWLGTHIAGRRHGVTGATLSLRAAGWLGAGGWCSWAIANGPWTAWGMGSLIAGALGLGAAMAGAHHVEEKAEAKKAEAQAEAKKASLAGKAAELAAEWDKRLADVCPGLLVQIVGVEQWESGTGYTLDGECAGGTKWKDFAGAQDSLAAHAKLPEGCGVIVKAGAHRGAVLFDVSTSNALIGDVPYPDDYSPLSLDGPLPIGVYRDASPVAPNMRQLTALVSGRKGMGKTNLLNVMLAGYARMTDNLVWVVDLNGGNLALPWLHAWNTAGKPGQPPIDWVADTPEKLLAMAEAALRIALARKPGYKHLEIAADDDKLPVSAKVPGILIAGDEIAEIYSPKARQDPILRKAGDTLLRVVELARAAAVNALISALRVTQDVLAEPQLLKQSGLKIAVKSDDAELGYMFGWTNKLTADDMPYPGTAGIKVLDEAAQPFKIYRMKPSRILDVVKATSDRRPELDALSRRAAGQAYELRWVGTDHLFGNGPTPEVAPQPVVEQQPEPGRGSGVTADWGKPDTSTTNADDVQALLDQADQTKKRLHDAMGEVANRDADLDRQFHDILRAGGAVWQPPATDGEDPRRQFVFDIVAKAGPDGIGPAAIIDAVKQLHPEVTPPNPDVIARWLNADPRIHRPRHGRYALRPDQK